MFFLCWEVTESETATRLVRPLLNSLVLTVLLLIEILCSLFSKFCLWWSCFSIFSQQILIYILICLIMLIEQIQFPQRVLECYALPLHSSLTKSSLPPGTHFYELWVNIVSTLLRFGKMVVRLEWSQNYHGTWAVWQSMGWKSSPVFSRLSKPFYLKVKLKGSIPDMWLITRHLPGKYICTGQSSAGSRSGNCEWCWGNNFTVCLCFLFYVD